MNDIYENIAEYNANKTHETIIVFDDMIADMLSNKKRNIKRTESFIRRRKLNISHVFITQSDFAMPKGIRLHSTHYFIMKLQQARILTNSIQSFIIYLIFETLVIDATLA